MNLNPILEISEPCGEYYTCNACDSKDNLKNISIGHDDGKNSQTQTIRLCKGCRQILKNKL